MTKKIVFGKLIVIHGTIQDPWFRAKDVAEWIEHSKISAMIDSVDDDEKGRKIVSTLGGNQEVWFVLTKEKLNEIVNKYQFVEVN